MSKITLDKLDFIRRQRRGWIYNAERRKSKTREIGLSLRSSIEGAITTTIYHKAEIGANSDDLLTMGTRVPRNGRRISESKRLYTHRSESIIYRDRTIGAD